ncbi:Hypothetical predicted protein [Mytilus galloprovincialis]|uniref:SRCR domain-containing protein n=1 Tax=Mytilus galloprovincialis TaxID=29158 RepID=A0A8B6D821_MYTGA|nr:Hypothetical predicted protein [Mytilus galloprovincialis]
MYSQGWTEENSAVVCLQLGLTYDPAHGAAKQKVPSSNTVMMSRVQCNFLDTDVTQCESEKYGEFNYCNVGEIVYLRCQPPTWTGITLPAVPKGSMPEPTQIRHVIIEHAGLLDADDMLYTPGLTIDYNYLKITGLIVRNSVSDGVNVKYSHPHTENLFEHCMFDNNQGHGFLTRSPFLNIKYATMNNNEKSGFVYDPFFTEYEALSVRNFIEPSLTVDLGGTQYYNLGDNSMAFIVTKPGLQTVDFTYMMQIYVSDRYRTTLQLLDYNPLTAVETVTIYDSNKDGITTNTKRWEIEKDLVDFPLISTSNYLTIAVKVRGVMSGRLAFAAHSVRYPFNPPYSQIHLYNCTIKENKQGILTKHYNNPSNEKLEIFHRIKEEELRFEMVNVYDNVEEAMYIPSLTKYHDRLIPTPEEMTTPERLGVIKYKMERCKFHRNGKGIIADHNHVDFANNVWQWKFDDSEIRWNKYGGFDIELPRVNDIVERKYHSVFVKDCRFQNNQQSVFTVNGYYANVTIMNSRFEDNTCLRGLVYIGGMEKDLTVYNNIFHRNIGKYAVELDMTSHSEYFDLGVGKFYVNSIADNRPSSDYTCVSSSNPVTYAVAIRGVQNITFNRNIFTNPLLQFEMLAGIYSLLVENTLNVKENWWGTGVQYNIRNKIFDFDDWNNYVIADYFPHLTAADIINDNAIASGSQENPDLDYQRLGGRISNRDLSLPSQSTPIRVVSDLTIMPDAKLIIPPGTELHFEPNVGILVLGQLIARGSVYSRIKFKPATKTSIGTGNNCRGKRSTPHTTSSSDTRLIRDSNGTIPANQGFLQLKNTTTGSWTLMCDSKFNKKTAEVVCRELGLETVNVDVRFTHLYDYFVFGKPMYFIKEFWTYSYYCRGDEPSLSHCMKRINYDIQKCIQASNYTFIRCGERSLDNTQEYWGNIRFAPKNYEITEVQVVPEDQRSKLEYVDIDGAGMLHGEKVGAIQSTYVTPVLENINITRCVWNGIDLVSPRYELEVRNVNASGNLGTGINVLMLNGESSDDETSSFTPLIINTVPYYMNGLIDICRMEKEIHLENRVIVYYKYSQYEHSCVKVIESSKSVRLVSFRLLQFNLYQDDFYRNVIEIFDGKDVTTDSLITELTANSTEADISKRYLATSNSISVHIHASSAHEHYGFVAEIVTSPLKQINYPDSTTSHKFEDIVLKNNEDGAIHYQNIGEVNPSIYFDRCWIEGNGLAILNLTSPPVIDFNIQNTITLNFQHSLVNKNKGGMYIHANAHSYASHLQANITNNVFSYGTNGEALNISGHHFQQFYIYENHIFNYSAGDFRDVVHVQNVGTNFTFNIIEGNVGHYILRIFNKADTDALQRFYANMLSNNNVTALKRSAIKVGSGHPMINTNYLKNPQCDFELETNPIIQFINGIPVQSKPIDARENWWGSERPNFVLGRIWDNRDNQSLITVNYLPIKVTNVSLIDGKCPPGWRLNDQRCYRYMGASLPYYDAIEFCKAAGGYLADSKDKENFLQYLLRLSENVYVDDLTVWVYSEVSKGYCSSLKDTYIVAQQDCHRKLLPFICERDPYIVAPGSDILAMAIGISAGVFGTGLIIVIILIIMWYIKSRRRKDERFERAASIRSSYSKTSLHNSRMTLRSRSTISMLTDGSPRKRAQHYDDRSSSGKYSGSMGSSKHKIYDSDESVTLGGIGIDERKDEMHRNIHRSREYLEDVIDNRDKMRNDHTFTGSRDRLDIPSGVSRSRERLDDKYGSKDSLSHSPRLGGPTRAGLGRRLPNKMENPRLAELSDRKNAYLKKPMDSPGSSLDRKLLKHGDDHLDTMTDDTFDGYSTNEFDDVTSETEAETVKFHPTKFSQINNEINCMQKLPSMDNVYANEHTPSIDRSKSLTSFLQPDNPPTPPPPLDGHTYKSSPDVSPKKPRPVPRPRSTRNSNVSSVGDYTGSKDDRNVPAPLHLSRENLNFAHKKPDWLADKLRETSASEDSDDDSINNSSYESGHNNQAYIGSHEDLSKKPYQKQLNIQIPMNDLSKPTTSNPPSLASDNLQNMDYMKDSYSSIDYGSHHHSRDNLPSPGYYRGGSREDLATPTNINRSRDNIPDQSYPYSGRRENTADPRYQYGGSREDLATPTKSLNRSRENITDKGYPYSRSRENISAPSYQYSGSRENLASPATRLGRSRENIAETPRNREDRYGSKGNLPYGSRDNISGYHGSRENLDRYHGNNGPPSYNESQDLPRYHGSREDLQEYRGSRDNLHHGGRGAPRYNGSQDNIHDGVLHLQNQPQQQHHSVETEI